MANWKKLNKEFDTVVNGITDEQLEVWMQQRKENKARRRKELEESVKNITDEQLSSWKKQQEVNKIHVQ